MHKAFKSQSGDSRRWETSKILVNPGSVCAWSDCGWLLDTITTLTLELDFLTYSSDQSEPQCRYNDNDARNYCGQL